MSDSFIQQIFVNHQNCIIAEQAKEYHVKLNSFCLHGTYSSGSNIKMEIKECKEMFEKV